MSDFYPQIGGEAVYRARAILGLNFDDSDVAYRLSSETAKSNTLRLYPNPSNSLVYIDYFVHEKESATIEISNSLNQIIKTYKLNENEQLHSINLSLLANGIYFVKLTSNLGSQYINKLTVVH